LTRVHDAVLVSVLSQEPFITYGNACLLSVTATYWRLPTPKSTRRIHCHFCHDSFKILSNWTHYFFMYF